MRKHFGKRQIKVASTFFSILCLILLQGCHGNPEAAQSLLSAFGGACASSGSWTQSALAHSQSLINVIQTIQNSDPCKPFISTLAQITSGSTQIQSLLNDQSYSDYRIAEENVQQLTLALQDAPPGSPLSAALGSQLVNAQIDLIQRRSASVVGSDIANRNRFASANLQLSSYAQSLLQNTRGIEACLQHSPAAAVSIASNLLALGGSFVSPIFGSAGAVVSQLIGVGVETARNHSSNKALWSLYRNQMPTALACGFEAMTELYCNANDAFDLLELQAKAYTRLDGNPNPIWQSLDLQERRIPVLRNWLISVRNGVLPTDQQEAQRQNNAWARLQALDTFLRNVNGEIRRNVFLYDGAAGNPAVQRNLLVTTIFNVAQILSGFSVGGVQNLGMPNPYQSLNATLEILSCWVTAGYFTGGNVTVCPPPRPLEGLMGVLYIDKILLPAFPNTGIQDILTNFNSIHAVISKQISLEFAQTITEDPTPILAAALQPLPDNISPRDVLIRIQEFLKQKVAEDDGSNPQKLPLLKDTIALFTRGLETISDTKDTPVDVKIRNLFEIFHLDRGLQFFDNRIGNFIKWDIQDKMMRGQYPKDITDLLRIAGGDIRTRLVESGVRNLDNVTADLNNSRSLTAGNIAIFREFFIPTLAKSIKMLSERAKKSGEAKTGPDRPFGQTLGHLCTLVLITGQEWPKKIPWELCAEASLSTIHPDPKKLLQINVEDLRKEIIGLNDQYRFCTYHRFLRASRLMEIINVTAKPNGPANTVNLMGLMGLGAK